MKAIVWTKYGPPDVLQLREIEKPIPGDNEVLIRIYATTVTSGDVKVRSFKKIPVLLWLPFRITTGLIRPKRTILGSDFAGVIEEVGKDVTRFKVGEQVFGIDGDDCATYAEYKCISEEAAISIKPSIMSYEEAAAIPFGAHTALFFLRDKGNIQSGHKVLIYGASGAVGTAAVQLARYFGAEVTGVCSTTNIGLIKSLRANHVIDYTKDDFTKNDEHYDIIFDTVTKTSFSHCKNSLKQSGVYIATFPTLSVIFQMLWTSVTGNKKVIHAVADERKEDLIFLKELIEAGKLKPVIDRSYPLERIAEAHSYVEKGHKKGNVVIKITHDQV
ncbi:NAD(P)-dependent alcohol dehydrogenase [Methanolobus sp. ZRKC5]|uniref:NAD(P)-dependent alcohol dehydrogenase n=1 Tax=unclassified Methanolobus TaxID=2629569 RepID=UPI00313CB12C